MSVNEESEAKRAENSDSVTRVLFIATVVLVAAGLVYFIALGLLHR